jgi:hypothetical protein
MPEIAGRARSNPPWPPLDANEKEHVPAQKETGRMRRREFRDRPVRPLRHLSVSDAGGAVRRQADQAGGLPPSKRSCFKSRPVISRDHTGSGITCARGRHRRCSSLKLLRSERGIIFLASLLKAQRHADPAERASSSPQPFGNRRTRLRFGIGRTQSGRRGDYFHTIGGIIEHRRRGPTPDCAARISTEHRQVRSGLPAWLHCFS